MKPNSRSDFVLMEIKKFNIFVRISEVVNFFFFFAYDLQGDVVLCDGGVDSQDGDEEDDEGKHPHL